MSCIDQKGKQSTSAGATVVAGVTVVAGKSTAKNDFVLSDQNTQRLFGQKLRFKVRRKNLDVQKPVNQRKKTNAKKAKAKSYFVGSIKIITLFILILFIFCCDLRGNHFIKMAEQAKVVKIK